MPGVGIRAPRQVGDMAVDQVVAFGVELLTVEVGPPLEVCVV